MLIQALIVIIGVAILVFIVSQANKDAKQKGVNSK